MRQLILTAAPSQTFSVRYAGQSLRVAVRYNNFQDRWAFDLAVAETPKVAGRKIVTGVDLLGAYALGFGLYALGETPGRDSFTTGKTRLVLQ